MRGRFCHTLPARLFPAIHTTFGTQWDRIFEQGDSVVSKFVAWLLPVQSHHGVKGGDGNKMHAVSYPSYASMQSCKTQLKGNRHRRLLRPCTYLAPERGQGFPFSLLSLPFTTQFASTFYPSSTHFAISWVSLYPKLARSLSRVY